jgi:hypothetical protein
MYKAGKEKAWVRINLRNPGRTFLFKGLREVHVTLQVFSTLSLLASANITGGNRWVE